MTALAVAAQLPVAYINMLIGNCFARCLPIPP